MFTVRWKRTALDELAALWTHANSAMRQAITDATNHIDQELRQDPASKGESREGRVRDLFALPFGVLCEVDGEHSIIRVLQI